MEVLNNLFHMDTAIVNEVTLLLFGGLVSAIVQVAKKLGINPMVMLAGVSVIAAGTYQVAVLRLSEEVLQNWGFIAIQIAGTANLIYAGIKYFLKK